MLKIGRQIRNITKNKHIIFEHPKRMEIMESESTEKFFHLKIQLVHPCFLNPGITNSQSDKCFRRAKFTSRVDHICP